MPLGWTPEGTATWQAANDALRDFISKTGDKPPCPWCYGQGGYLVRSEITSGYIRVLCEGCFGTGKWVSGDAAP
jgi:DnaJ-class molecular chaperone